MDIQWAVVKKDLTELQEYEHNPRILTPEKLKHLEESIRKFGCAEPIIINTDNTICGGHGRKRTLQKLKVKEVDCYVPSRTLTPEEFDELNIRLNKNVAGKFDLDILSNRFEFDELQDFGFSLRDLGMDTNMEYDPNLNPQYANTFIEESDMEKARQNELNRFSPDQTEKRQITCPKCYAEFEVNNE